MEHTHLVTYQEKGITDVLHRVVKANSEKEAEYLLKLRQDPDNKLEITVKRIRLIDGTLAD
jgi:hypothetical protein|nr:MAG TPA: hypothetical protein [Caudoviricetes sp.]